MLTHVLNGRVDTTVNQLVSNSVKEATLYARLSEKVQIGYTCTELMGLLMLGGLLYVLSNTTDIITGSACFFFAARSGFSLAFVSSTEHCFNAGSRLGSLTEHFKPTSSASANIQSRRKWWYLLYIQDEFVQFVQRPSQRIQNHWELRLRKVDVDGAGTHSTLAVLV